MGFRSWGSGVLLLLQSGCVQQLDLRVFPQLLLPLKPSLIDRNCLEISFDKSFRFLKGHLFVLCYIPVLVPFIFFQRISLGYADRIHHLQGKYFLQEDPPLDLGAGFLVRDVPFCEIRLRNPLFCGPRAM